MEEIIDHSMLEGENIRTIKNEYVELGINMNLGGAVTYFAEHGRPNLINSHDWGRQVQMSFYSGPNPFEPEGHEVNQGWRFLGWNPIQCGDCYGNRSQIILFEESETEIHIKCRPMHWPIYNYPGECTFEEWFTLDGKSVRVHARLNNARPEKVQYEARSQELPAVYTNGPWYKLISYVGTEPFTGADTTVLVDIDDGRGWPWGTYRMTESWAALVDVNNYGLGVCNPYTNVFIAGFAGKKGAGGPKDGPTGYISPLLTDILDSDIVYDYYYTLTAGTIEEIRAFALANNQPQTRKFSFADNRSHWYYRGIKDEGLGLGALVFDYTPGGKLCGPDHFYKNFGGVKLIGEFDRDKICGKLHAKEYAPKAEDGTVTFADKEIGFTADVKNGEVVIGADFADVSGFSIEFACEGHARITAAEVL